MFFFKVLIDIATCFCIMLAVKKICEFLFYRYLAGIDNYVMQKDELLSLLFTIAGSVILYIIGVKLPSGSVTKFMNLLGLGAAVVAFIMVKWKRSDTGEHVLMSYIPGIISIMLMEFILMVR